MVAFSVLNAIPSPSATSLILIVSSLALFLFYYLRRKHSYWERRGVPFLKPALFYGNTKDMTLRRTPMVYVFQKIYDELDGHKFGGYYQFMSPNLMLRDPDLIRNFLVKSFSHFHDRNMFLDEKLDPLSVHLLRLTGQRWKNVRSKLTPTFSSGKLRLMQDLMNECTRELDAYLTDVTKDDSKTTSIVNVSELMGEYAMDVIGSCALGLHGNSIRDENSGFRRIRRLLAKPNYRARIRILLMIFSPRLISIFKVKLLNPEVEEFFMSILHDAFKYRESAEEERNDFLQLLIDIQAEEKKQQSSQQQQNGIGSVDNIATEPTSDILFTDKVIASNAFAFFIAGFETTAATLSFCLYELALNPEICEKVKNEVESVKRAHDGNLDYDVMKELAYLDAVISETLRKYPVGFILSRRCTEAFQIPGTSVVIEKGRNVTVSVYGLHHDPKYFPEPEKFLPERFSKENKHTILPGTYLPFGDGPRNCIGMRFAMFEMKSVLSYLVSNFTFHPCEKTAVPLEFDRRSFFLKPQGGIWIRFQKRSSQ